MNARLLANTRENTARAGARVLIVDDHAKARESMADVLSHAGHQVQCSASAFEALELLKREDFDVVVTDLKMPGMTGIEFIRQLEGRRHGAQVIMVTAYASVSSAVEAMRHGAYDYIEKPFDAEQLEKLVERAIQQGRLLDKTAAIQSHDSSTIAMIGSGRAMTALRAQIAQIGPTNETVLIVGESGTGKELVARSLHAASSRRDSALVSLNCPALSAQLMESELFGHERGAFTGADAPRTGRFELAGGGTILLDEITEIELSLQAKLLRVLQEKSFERVGSNQTISVDVRVLATTNRDLSAAVAAGKFRDDLYYRLNVVPLRLPPLRERREDIPELAAHFLRMAAARLNRKPCELARAGLEVLCNHDWPGNIREMENLMTRATVLNSGEPITADELRAAISERTTAAPARQSEGLPLGLSLHDTERKLIEATLERFGGHRAKTAGALGIGIRTLSGKLREYGYAPRAKMSKVA